MGEVKISGMNLDQWFEFAKRDDCLDQMEPSDLRQILALVDDRAKDAPIWPLLLELYEEDAARLFLATPQPKITGHNRPPSEMLARGEDMKPLVGWIEGCFAQTAT